MIEMNESEILELFLEEAYRIWANPSMFDRIEFDCVIRPLKWTPKKRTLAMVEQTYREDRRMKARGNVLIHVATECTLVINPPTMELDYDDFVRVIRHEAIHLGISNHGKGFKALCRRFDASITPSDLPSYLTQFARIEHIFTIEAQFYKGQRFIRVYRYDTLEGAKADFENVIAELKPKGLRQIRIFQRHKD